MAIAKVSKAGIAEPWAGWTKEQTEWALGVERCFVCGKNVWCGDFIFWQGEEMLAFHPECCRDMCLGLLVDVVKLTGTLKKASKSD